MKRQYLLIVLSLLTLSGCGGGANLYAGPLGDFELAVDQTGRSVRIYDGLEQQLARATTSSATVLQASAVLGFDVQACAAAKDETPSTTCALLGADKKPLFARAQTPSKTVQLMNRIETYAALLADIAGAVSVEELKARQKSADQALDKLHSGLGALEDGDTERGLGDFKAAATDALASAYLQSQRRKLLITLVKDADPVVRAGAKALGLVLGDVRTSFVETQAFRINLQVQNFNNLGALLKNAQGAASQAQAQVLRREALERLIRDSTQVQAVAQTDVAASFDDLAKAHGALLQALEFSASGIGQTIEAIENFTAASRKASDALSMVQGMI